MERFWRLGIAGKAACNADDCNIRWSHLDAAVTCAALSAQLKGFSRCQRAFRPQRGEFKMAKLKSVACKSGRGIHTRGLK